MIQLSFHTCIRYFVPIVMLVVFCVQLVLVEYGNLDRWKGMGMGMFSGISSRGVESIEVQVDGRWESVVDEISESHPNLVIDLRQFPNTWTEARVLRAVQETEPRADTIRVIVTEVTAFNVRTGLVTEQVLYGTVTE